MLLWIPERGYQVGELFLGKCCRSRRSFPDKLLTSTFCGVLSMDPSSLVAGRTHTQAYVRGRTLSS